MKHYRMRVPKGVGKSSNWRLVVEPLVRDGVQFPQGGIPFSVVLTIADDRKEAAVFDEMRVWLNANNVKIGDIRTAARLRP